MTNRAKKDCVMYKTRYLSRIEQYVTSGKKEDGYVHILRLFILARLLVGLQPEMKRPTLLNVKS
jgi:hypothetical protein